MKNPDYFFNYLPDFTSVVTFGLNRCTYTQLNTLLNGAQDMPEKYRISMFMAKKFGFPGLMKYYETLKSEIQTNAEMGDGYIGLVTNALALLKFAEAVKQDDSLYRACVNPASTDEAIELEDDFFQQEQTELLSLVNFDEHRMRNCDDRAKQYVSDLRASIANDFEQNQGQYPQ